VNREVFRLAPPLILWWVWTVFAVANIADFAIQGASVRFAVVVSAILATVTGLAYALALRPRVIVGQDGLTIVNPFRDHHLPWAAIQAVDTGEWVRVHYAPGREAAHGSGSGSGPASNAISCWALYISARTKRRVSARTKRRATRAAQSGSRLPEEARYLASVPAAKAIAVRLDARAARERARAGPAGAAAGVAADAGGTVTVRWAWPSTAAVAVPALVLVIVAVVL
jgi:hypothetical protein